MIDFNTLNIGDTFDFEGETMILTGKILDDAGNLVGVSYQPVVPLSE